VANRELPENPDFVPPKKPLRALTIQELRGVVSARHKYLAASKPTDEAVELIQEEYGADTDSCVNFVTWINGGTPIEPTSTAGMDRIHKTTDPNTGVDTAVETQPGSIPPRPL